MTRTLRPLALGLLVLGLCCALPLAAADKKDDGKREAPQIDATTGKQLNAAIEFLNDDNLAAAKGAIAKLDLESLSPYERSRVEQILASIAHSEDDYPGARKHLEAALAAGGLNAQEVTQIRFQIAQLYLAQEQWKQGAAALEEWFAVADKPNSAAYYMLASAYYQMQDYARALAPAKKAVEMTDKPQPAWVELVLALYLAQERWNDAIPMLKKLIAATPDNKTYWQQLWSIHGQQENYAQALVMLELAAHAGLLTEGEEFTRMADQLMYVGIPYRAAEVLTNAVENKKVAADAAIHEKIGNAWLAAREYDRAIPQFKRAFELSGKGDMSVRIGEIELQRNAFESAEAALRTALAKGGLKDSHNTELLLGIALFNQNKFDEARGAFENAARSAAQRPTARGYLNLIETRAP